MWRINLNKMTVTILAIASLFAVQTGRADGDLVFFCNYDILFTVDDSIGQINSRARVRDGHAIPIEFQKHKIDIVVAKGGDNGVNFAITLFEKSGESWYKINPEPLTFGGTLGVPVQYQWSSGGLSLDAAISVSPNQDPTRE